MAGSPFTSLDNKFDQLSKELSGKAGLQRLERVGKKVAPKVAEAVSSDLGDTSMSGWRRGAPIAIKGVAKVEDNSVVIEPNPKGKGPARVLESGRNQGNASGFSGPGINRTTGETSRTKAGKLRKVRARKGKQWNGYTTGRGTWSKASEQIAKEAPKLMAAEASDAMAGLFLKG